MAIPSKAFEYYLQGFRLHSLMTKKGSAQAQEMFKLATEAEPGFARAYGHLAYTRLLAWLNGWIELNKPPADIRALADKAVALDGSDYDNLWSKAGVYLYTARFQKDPDAGFQQGFDLFDQALKAAPKNAIDFNIEGLRIDIADAKFFAGANGLADVNHRHQDNQGGDRQAQSELSEAVPVVAGLGLLRAGVLHREERGLREVPRCPAADQQSDRRDPQEHHRQ